MTCARLIKQELLNSLLDRDVSSSADRTTGYLELLVADRADDEALIHSYLEKVLQGLESLQFLTASLDALIAAVPQVTTQCFVQFFPTWLAKLTELVQKQNIEADARHKAWTAITTVFVRIAETVNIQGVRKDASQAAKEIFNVIAKSSSEGLRQMTATQISVLCGIAEAVGPALKAQLDNLRENCLRMLVAEGTSKRDRLAASRLLSLAPQISGDGKTWDLLAKQLVDIANVVLSGILLEKDHLTEQFWRSLPADVLQIVGSSAWQRENANAFKIQVWIDTLAGLLDCLERLMTHSPPAPVTLPARAVFKLFKRIIEYKDHPNVSGSGVSKVAEQQCILLMPALQVAALKLSQTWLQVGGTSLMPFHAKYVSLLQRCLESCRVRSVSPWPVRLELFRAVAHALQVVGRGAVPPLLNVIKKTVIAELMSRAKATEEHTKERSSKRQKKSHGTADHMATLSHDLPTTGQSLEVQTQMDSACVEALSFVLQAGGGSVKQQDRLELELLVLHIAQTSYQNASAHRSDSLPTHTVALGVEHHVKILQALARVCLASSASKPAILPEAIKQFETGLHSGNSQIRQICQESLLQINALLHPRQTNLLGGTRESESSASLSAAVQQISQTILDIRLAHAPPSNPGTSLLDFQQAQRVQPGKNLPLTSNTENPVTEKELQVQVQHQAGQANSSEGAVVEQDSRIPSTHLPSKDQPSAKTRKRSLEHVTVAQPPVSKQSNDPISQGNKDAKDGSVPHLQASNQIIQPALQRLPSQPSQPAARDSRPSAAMPSQKIGDKKASFDSDDESLPEIDLGVSESESE